MTTQHKDSLNYAPHQWLTVQRASLKKEQKIQSLLFRFDNPELAERTRLAGPVFPETSDDPAVPLTPPDRTFAATWSATIARSRSFGATRQRSDYSGKEPAAHLDPPRPRLQCNSKGELYQVARQPASPPAVMPFLARLQNGSSSSLQPLDSAGVQHAKPAGIPTQVASPGAGTAQHLQTSLSPSTVSR
eukprot:TRINITY_DN84755_c0_g1_i1.p1 TRINITY_DN84755_c0_g1~~TRINITY_DN84755_c0_g1_i1.p1  ORF type:complete len:189 (-),score=21.44 TRINITY_DN84755_c0_g1_i1:165-731(-)